MNSCPGPNQTLSGPVCSLDLMHNWPEDGDFDAWCAACREKFGWLVDNRVDWKREG